MTNELTISVLDIVEMRLEEPVASAIARTVELAQYVEEWGYKRFWLGEHHSISGVAGSAPAVLVGHVAAATERIRVGAGGVMLPNHAPLVVAEQFGTLEALFPGRIDLGVGRAPGGDPHAVKALGRIMVQGGDLSSRFDTFSELLEELRGYLEAEKPGQAVRAIPGQGSHVPITLLGSSVFSAQLAGRLGLPYAFAAQFAPENRIAAAEAYRKHFRPSETRSKPYLLVAVPVIAAATDGAAKRLFTTLQQRALRLIRNEPVWLLPPVDSMLPLWSTAEQAAVEKRLAAAIVGSNRTVDAGLERLICQTGADEVIVVTATYAQEDRLESFFRVAEIAAGIGMESANQSEEAEWLRTAQISSPAPPRVA